MMTKSEVLFVVRNYISNLGSNEIERIFSNDFQRYEECRVDTDSGIRFNVKLFKDKNNYLSIYSNGWFYNYLD